MDAIEIIGLIIVLALWAGWFVVSWWRGQLGDYWSALGSFVKFFAVGALVIIVALLIGNVLAITTGHWELAPLTILILSVGVLIWSVMAIRQEDRQRRKILDELRAQREAEAQSQVNSSQRGQR
jgi:uncharacterized protein YacL